MPRRIDPEQAVARMRAAGAEPLEPYLNADAPWRCRCLRCGEIITPRLSSMSRQKPCRSCGRATTRHDPARAESAMRAMGLEPLEPYPGAEEPWLHRCVECGDEVTLSYRRRTMPGAGCRRCPPDQRGGALRTPVERTPVDPEVAAATMRAAGFEPLVPYPGRVEAPWSCRCMACGHESTPRLSIVRLGSGCRACADRAIGARHIAANAAAAVALMRAAGFEPLEEYRGSHQPWRCRCIHCGEVSTPRRASVRRGHGCKHCWRGAGG